MWRRYLYDVFARLCEKYHGDYMEFKTDNIWNDIKSNKRIGLTGHLRPDGDCVGSCLAFANYVTENFDKKIDVYLESVPEAFSILKGSDCVITDYPEADPYDLFIVLDCGDEERFGDAIKYYRSAKITYSFDHHPTDNGFADYNSIAPEAAATAELLGRVMDMDKISVETAKCLFLGIVHDTGVFKHSNTTRATMEMAGLLIEKGVMPGEIIDKTFYEKTYVQNQILGRSLMESILLLEGNVIASSVSLEVQKLYGITNSDMDGIVDQLRVTKGIEVAILLKENTKREWKVSMRSNRFVDVSQIAVKFGGGGHVRAAGCTLHGSVYDVYNSIVREIEIQLKSIGYLE